MTVHTYPLTIPLLNSGSPPLTWAYTFSVPKLRGTRRPVDALMYALSVFDVDQLRILIVSLPGS